MDRAMKEGLSEFGPSARETDLSICNLQKLLKKVEKKLEKKRARIEPRGGQ